MTARSPGQLEWRYEFAQVLHEQGRLEEARRELRLLLQQHPDHQPAVELHRDVVRSDVGVDGFLPRADAGERVGGHMEGVRRVGREIRVLARVRQRARRQRMRGTPTNRKAARISIWPGRGQD